MDKKQKERHVRSVPLLLLYGENSRPVIPCSTDQIRHFAAEVRAFLNSHAIFTTEHAEITETNTYITASPARTLTS